MRRRTFLVLVTLALGLAAAACVRPIHARTYPVRAGATERWDHPATVSEGQVELALQGRVAAADLPGLPAAMARAFAHLAPHQVIYYRHPDGGGWRFGVRGGELVVTPVGLMSARAHAQRYPLADLDAAEARRAPPKRLVRGAPTASGHADAELEVEVAFAVPQAVFLGDTFLGLVRPGQTRVFVVPAGRATVVVSDGKAGANDVRLELSLEPGQVEHLSVEPEL